jgi:hypothetical protein
MIFAKLYRALRAAEVLMVTDHRDWRFTARGKRVLAYLREREARNA